MQRTRDDLAKLQPHYPDMINEVIDLTDHSRNMIFNMTPEEATEIVASGDPEKIATIDGHFAIMARSDTSSEWRVRCNYQCVTSS